MRHISLCASLQLSRIKLTVPRLRNSVARRERAVPSRPFLTLVRHPLGPALPLDLARPSRPPPHASLADHRLVAPRRLRRPGPRGRRRVRRAARAGRPAGGPQSRGCEPGGVGLGATAQARARRRERRRGEVARGRELVPATCASSSLSLRFSDRDKKLTPSPLRTDLAYLGRASLAARLVRPGLPAAHPIHPRPAPPRHRLLVARRRRRLDHYIDRSQAQAAVVDGTPAAARRARRERGCQGDGRRARQAGAEARAAADEGLAVEGAGLYRGGTSRFSVCSRCDGADESGSGSGRAASSSACSQASASRFSSRTKWSVSP